MSVTVYSTPSCPYCVMAKRYFKENKISFTDYDVSRDQTKADEMIRKSGQMGVPVLDINGQILVGFDKGRVEKALKR
ncbi:glutaredoxin family protein [Spirochaeta cellobiosiphila]|uniref:glutaredoxin family protein n=1 Tax=Spirochaeta cellobiosiphila TaxID=504483 RepID=UPI00041CB1BC|nr:glutaredoxin domain-containing protein [Spirochaeta cellobiosiphila]